MDDAASIFDELFQSLQNVPVDGNETKHWCFGKSMEDMAKFSEILDLIVRLLDKCEARFNIDSEGEQLLQKKQLVNLYGYLYDTLVSNIGYFSTEIETCKDKYADTPLVNIYIAIATVVLFVNAVWPNFDSFMDKRQSDIPYCVDHQLNIVDAVPISNFSIEEWLSSVNRIVYLKDKLTFCTDLVTYIDALEFRLCQFLLNCYDKRVHNIEAFRVYVEEMEGFVFSSSGEFQFIVSMMSLRFTINGATEVLRDYTAPMYIEADIELAARTQAVLVERASKIYDVSYKAMFKEEYVQRNTTIAEGFLYLKSRGFPDDVKHAEAVRQFRVASDWMRISEKMAPEHLKIHEHLRRPKEDIVAFKVAFKMVMNIIFLETISVSWLDYYFTGYDIACSYEHEFEKIMKRSETVPMFVESLSDACILTNRRLVVFGKDPIDYLMAFVHWITIVINVCKYKLNAAVHIHKLMAEIYGTPLAPKPRSDTSQISVLAARMDRVLGMEETTTFSELEDLDCESPPHSPSFPQPSSSGSSFACSSKDFDMDAPVIETSSESYFSSLFNDRAQERSRYEAINKIIPNIGEDLDSIPAFVNLDQKGLPLSLKSGWIN